MDVTVAGIATNSVHSRTDSNAEFYLAHFRVIFVRSEQTFVGCTRSKTECIFLSHKKKSFIFPRFVYRALISKGVYIKMCIRNQLGVVRLRIVAKYYFARCRSKSGSGIVAKNRFSEPTPGRGPAFAEMSSDIFFVSRPDSAVVRIVVA